MVSAILERCEARPRELSVVKRIIAVGLMGNLLCGLSQRKVWVDSLYIQESQILYNVSRTGEIMTAMRTAKWGVPPQRGEVPCLQDYEPPDKWTILRIKNCGGIASNSLVIPRLTISFPTQEKLPS